MYKLIPVFLVSTLFGGDIPVSAHKLENPSIADTQFNSSPKLLLAQEVADGSECSTTKCPNRGDGRQDKGKESTRVPMLTVFLPRQGVGHGFKFV